MLYLIVIIHYYRAVPCNRLFQWPSAHEHQLPFAAYRYGVSSFAEYNSLAFAVYAVANPKIFFTNFQNLSRYIKSYPKFILVKII